MFSSSLVSLAQTRLWNLRYLWSKFPTESLLLLPFLLPTVFLPSFPSCWLATGWEGRCNLRKGGSTAEQRGTNMFILHRVGMYCDYLSRAYAAPLDRKAELLCVAIGCAGEPSLASLPPPPPHHKMLLYWKWSPVSKHWQQTRAGGDRLNSSLQYAGGRKSLGPLSGFQKLEGWGQSGNILALFLYRLTHCFASYPVHISAAFASCAPEILHLLFQRHVNAKVSCAIYVSLVYYDVLSLSGPSPEPTIETPWVACSSLTLPTADPSRMFMSG